MWFSNWFYRPDSDCLKYWRDAEYVSFTFWRFMWLKQRPERFLHWEGKPEELRVHKPNECWMWAYRYVPIYKRLYWCEEWMGTHNDLMPLGCYILICGWSAVFAIALATIYFVYGSGIIK